MSERKNKNKNERRGRDKDPITPVPEDVEDSTAELKPEISIGDLKLLRQQEKEKKDQHNGKTAPTSAKNNQTWRNTNGDSRKKDNNKGKKTNKQQGKDTEKASGDFKNSGTVSTASTSKKEYRGKADTKQKSNESAKQHHVTAEFIPSVEFYSKKNKKNKNLQPSTLRFTKRNKSHENKYFYNSNVPEEPPPNHYYKKPVKSDKNNEKIAKLPNEYDSYQEFVKLYNSVTEWQTNGVKIVEVAGDLFTAPNCFSLAHCVAEDMQMSSGIAKDFRFRFGNVAFLLNQNQKTGGLAVLYHNNRFIYYLVTKKYSRGKPTMYHLWVSLRRMKRHIEEYKVKHLAIPQIGCGLDRLCWVDVKAMLEYIFVDVDINIVVYILEDATKDTVPKKNVRTKCPVVHAVQELVDIEAGTALVYFGSEDGIITEELEGLIKKYNILPTYRAHKRIGDVLKTESQGDFIYGLIIKRHYSDVVNYEILENTIKKLKHMIRKDKYNYIGFQGFIDLHNDGLLDKILSLMQFILKDIEIWVCWSEKIKDLWPPYVA